MMKFFRKHNKQLLAIFMCLLLVCWLGGDALEAMLRPASGREVVAVCAAGNITRDEWTRAQFQTELLRKLFGSDWQRIFGLARGPENEPDIASFFLLVREARRMGIHSSRPVAEDMLRQMLRRQGANPPSVAYLAGRWNIKPDAIYEAVTAFTDLVRYRSQMAQAADPSAAEIRRTADNVFSQVQVKTVAFRAEMFEDSEETFPEGEMREQFDKFKDHQPGTGLNFGYVLPPRLKVQYAKIDVKKIEETLTDDQKVEKDALYYWKGHKQDPAFRRPPAEKTNDVAASQPTTQDADPSSQPTTRPASQPTTQPASQPSTEPASQPSSAPADLFFTTWSEAQKAAIEVLRRQHADERAQRLADWLLAQTAEPWYHVEVGSNGYKAPPEAVKSADYYTKKVSEIPASLPGAEGVIVETTDWISRDNASDVPGLGAAALPIPGGTAILFAQVVFNVEGLAAIPTGEEAAGVDRTTYLALYQTSPYALHDIEGNIYVFRPVEVSEERPARELEEVRERVVTDLRKVRGYEKAKTQADDFAAKARENGLETAWKADSPLHETADRYNETPEGKLHKGGFMETVTVARWLIYGEPVREVYPLGTVNEAFVEACFGMREAKAATPRLQAVPIPEAGTVAVIEWAKNLPLNEQAFQQRRAQVAQYLERQRMADYLSAWLDPKQIKARNQFEFKRGG
jgi:hypothetical protein